MGLAFGCAVFSHSYGVGIIRASEFLSFQVTVRDVLLITLLCFCSHHIFKVFCVYREHDSKWTEQCLRLAAALLINAILTLVIAMAARIQTVTLRFTITFLLFSFIFIQSYRFISQGLVSLFRTRMNHRRVVVIAGSGVRALQLAERLSKAPQLGYEVAGYIDDRWSGSETMESRGYRYLGNLASLDSYLQNNVVDEVIIALPLASFYRQALHLIQTCEEQGIVVRCLSDLFPTQLTKSVTEVFNGDYLTTFHGRAFESGSLLVKRFVDLLVSAVLLLLLLPLFIVVAIVIKLSSAGPVFFVQTRAGLNRRPFQMYKFRTMVQDAEQQFKAIVNLNEETGPAFKIKCDPRITRTGAVLRRTSIDELPQLLNVLKGDMSLVGPRPLFQYEYERIDQSWIKRRFSIKPGLTGLWQVSGRSDLPFDSRIKLDLYYIDNWSLLFDCQLLLKTIPAVLLGKGAV